MTIKTDIYGRKDRSDYTIDDFKTEIVLAEAILDGMGATTGLTLWGRIESLKAKEKKDG